MEGILKRFLRLVAAFGFVLVALGALVYMEGLHAAHPVTTLIKAPPTSGAARRLFVSVKGGSADQRTPTHNPPAEIRANRAPWRGAIA